MPWTLMGSYAETCSCELMCPCNLSFDHGATYDFCRATLAFHVREGRDRRHRRRRAQRGGDHRHPEGDDRRQLAARDVHRRAGERRAGGQARQGLRRSARRSHGGLVPLVGEVARRRTGADRADRRRACAMACASGTRSTSRSRTSCPSASRRRAGPVRRHVPPGRVRSHDGRGQRSRINAFGIEYEGKTGLSTSEFSWAS
jgi:hypothetical protein